MGRPLNLADPLGLWSKRAHDYFIDEFFKKAFPNLLGEYWLRDSMKEGSAYADSAAFHSSEFSYMHAMSSRVHDETSARNMMCRYVEAYVGVYHRLQSSSNWQDRRKAYYYLGMAMHAVMDSTSPLHRGFQYWPSHVLGHGAVDRTSRESLRHAGAFRDETVGLMNRVLNGDLSACGCN